ncbi:MAG: CRISPR-associated helicase Cas3' [Acidobacteriota bacterium]
MITRTHYSYWGKSCRDSEQNFHRLAYHCLDVAAVGSACLEHGSLQALFSVGDRAFDRDGLPAWLGFFLCLHDLGKFASSFQGLKPDIVEALGRPACEQAYSVRHDALGLFFWNKGFRQALKNSDAPEHSTLAANNWRELEPLARSVFGHHGAPPDPRPKAVFSEHFTPLDQQAALDFITDAYRLFGLEAHPWPDVDEKRLALLSWPLAGLAVLSDWIGSDETMFPYVEAVMSLEDYYHGHARPNAARALERSGVLAPNPTAWNGFSGLFPEIASPSPLQAHVSSQELGNGPSLHILEDVTGSGKTEAALALAHRLMDAGHVRGMYLGLPTMATASAMYSRMRAAYRRLFDKDGSPSLVLAHASRDMDSAFTKSVSIETGQGGGTEEEQKNQAFCAAWLADNRKKSLLAAVGVGTLDQALLAVMPARHQALRLLGLGRSVLIADEVHAYDAYTTKLLEALLRFQGALGGSAILLSATLPGRIKRKLTDAFASGAGAPAPQLCSQEYPLATSVSADGGAREVPIETRPDVSRWTGVSRLESPDAAQEAAVRAARDGACVLYVRNCVDDAVEAHRQLSPQLPDGCVDLFHARFALCDRQAIEERILERFGKRSTPEQRAGHVVVATQVAEQSLDVDFDLVISDLAPMESLLQRAGRCCRHSGRERPGGYGDARLLVVSPTPEETVRPDWYKAMFPIGAFVYPGHGRLWLTARRLFHRGGFDLSQEGRELMEYVYGQEATDEAPEALAKSDLDYEGGKLAEASMAWDKSLSVNEGYCQEGGLWTDDEGVFTRLGEKTTTLCLCRFVDGRVLPWAQGGDAAMDWRRSEMRVRQSRLQSGEAPSEPGAARALAEAVESMPGGGRWVTPVLLRPVPEEQETWSFQGRDGKGNLVTVRYSQARGLEWGSGAGS